MFFDTLLFFSIVSFILFILHEDIVPVTMETKIKQKKEARGESGESKKKKKSKPVHRCGAPRANGKGQCRMRVKEPGQKCCYHDNSLKFFKPKRPLDQLSLPEDIMDHDQMTVAARTKLSLLIEKGPSPKDLPGRVYMFKHIEDSEPDIFDPSFSFRKIGTTKRTIKSRLSEWPGSVLVKYWEVPAHMWYEKVIHAVFDFCRVYRYPFQKDPEKPKQYLSFWKSDNKKGHHKSGTVVFDSNLMYYRSGRNRKALNQIPREYVKKVIDKQGEKIRMGKLKKEIEWFVGKETTMITVCELIVKLLNEWAI